MSFRAHYLTLAQSSQWLLLSALAKITSIMAICGALATLSGIQCLNTSIWFVDLLLFRENQQLLVAIFNLISIMLILQLGDLFLIPSFGTNPAIKHVFRLIFILKLVVKYISVKVTHLCGLHPRKTALTLFQVD